ncbi:MAG TPA: hypothetical protein VJ259_02605, partial [Actinomycetota bacterium]|nr:hypothetical protein [Actinomycetota bacterium]
VTGPVERAKEARQAIAEQVVPRARDIPGLRNAYWMADEVTGKVVSLTLFESEADLVASREAVTKIREEAVKSMGGTIQSVEEFEVIAQV